MARGGKLKYTHESYVQKVMSKNPNIEIIGTFISTKEKIEVKCKIDGHVWNPVASELINNKNKGCKICAIRKKTMTNETFLEKFYNIYDDSYVIIDDYTNTRTPITVFHKLCGNSRKTTPKTLLTGHGNCPYCASNANQTHSDFINKINSEDLREYKFLEEYKTSKTPILVRHNVCGSEYKVLPSDFLEGHRCRNCAIKNNLLDISCIIDRVDVYGNKEFEIVGEYNGVRNKLELIHKLCNKSVFIKPSAIPFHGIHCEDCERKKRIEEKNDILKDIIKTKCNNEYKILVEYNNTNEKIQLLHIPCNTEINIKYHDFIYGVRCPKCQESKGERRINDFLVENNIFFERQKKFDGLVGIGGRKLSYDFIIGDNILCEYQGQFHDGTTNCQTEKDIWRQREHDRRKREFACNMGYKLIEIWYWDFDKIEEILDRELGNLIEVA